MNDEHIFKTSRRVENNIFHGHVIIRMGTAFLNTASEH